MRTAPLGMLLHDVAAQQFTFFLHYMRHFLAVKNFFVQCTKKYAGKTAGDHATAGWKTVYEKWHESRHT
jgi:hypothetical protein